jgi:hypothetical protein
MRLKMTDTDWRFHSRTPPFTFNGPHVACAPEHGILGSGSSGGGISFTPRTTETEIKEVCDEIKDLLVEKNRKYGDSALSPSRIFSKSDAVEQIKVRIDDKLTRLRNQQSDEDEDVVKDLIGYLVLLRIAQSRARQYKNTEFVSGLVNLHQDLPLG